MFETFIYNDIDPDKVSKQFDKTIEQLSRGDFASAEVKKMGGTVYYRAKLDYENRLLFKFARYNNQTCLLALEVIFNHEYDKSRFLRGSEVNESKLISIKNHQEVPADEFLPLMYVNRRSRHFHLLDKVLSFDDDQAEILALSLPQIIIGSAGSGKTTLTLEKIKSLNGKVLYITLSPYLAENSAQLFYSYNYENENLETDFLSYREYIETLRIPEGKELDFKTFEIWFSRNKQATKLKDSHKTFEEFRGVITGLDITKEHLSREDYLALGVKQSIFLAPEREMVYHLFEKYLIWLKENNYYDINILSHRWLPHCTPGYDFIVVDEVQDFTNIQLHIILKSLKKPINFMLCGDSNQVVYPNFFSWSHLKSMFYKSDVKSNDIKILHVNYRNSQTISGLANLLLKIKNARFGSIDKESNYLVNTVSETKGEVVFIENKGNAIADLGRKTRLSVKYAVLVLRNEDKTKAKTLFQTPLLFSVPESKGLEYENIILYNFISENAAEYNTICDDVTQNDLLVDELAYARGKDKTDKSLDIYKFYINSLCVAVTRAGNYETERGSIFRKHYQYYRDDNVKMIIPFINKYGIDYRDVHNFTPLHAAVFSGACNITKTLLDNGANPALFNTFRKTPIQIAFEQAFVLPDYARNKLGKIFPLLLSDSMKIQVDGRLIKIDSHKIEYLLINFFIAVQSVILRKKRHYQSMGIKIDDIVDNIQHFSETVIPQYRKKREYLLSLLAKHEVDSNNPYNKKIFKRIDRGSYLLNPGLQIQYDEKWISLSSISDNQDISEDEIIKHSIEKQKKEWEEYRKKFEKERKKRGRERWGW